MKVMVIVKASKASEAGEMPSTELLTAMGNYWRRGHRHQQLTERVRCVETRRPTLCGIRAHWPRLRDPKNDGLYLDQVGS